MYIGRVVLFYLDGDDEHANYLTTVSEQKNHFSNIDTNKANLSRYIQEFLSLPSDNDFADVIERGGIKERWVDRRHTKIANIIFGPN